MASKSIFGDLSTPFKRCIPRRGSRFPLVNHPSKATKADASILLDLTPAPQLHSPAPSFSINGIHAPFLCCPSTPFPPALCPSVRPST